VGQGVVIRIIEGVIMVTTDNNNSHSSGSPNNRNTTLVSYRYLRRRSGEEINWGTVNYNTPWADRITYKHKSQHNKCRWLQLIMLSIWGWFLHLQWSLLTDNTCLLSFQEHSIPIFIHSSFISSQASISLSIQAWCLPSLIHCPRARQQPPRHLQ